MHTQRSHQRNTSSISSNKHRVINKALNSSVKKKKIIINIPDMEPSTMANTRVKLNDWKLSDFELVKEMGRGKFGNVYAARERSTDYLVALKKMSKRELK